MMFDFIFAEYRFCIYHIFQVQTLKFHASAMFVTENCTLLSFTVASSGLPQLAV